MMIVLNLTGTVEQRFINGSVNGKPFGVSFDEAKWQKMLELQKKSNTVETMDEMKAIVEEFTPLTEESYKEMVEYKTPYIYVNRHTNKFFLKFGDKVSRNPLPKEFVDRIVTSLEKNIDIDPLIKCWARYQREVPGRPSYSESRAKLVAQYINAPYKDTKVEQELMAKGLAPNIASEMATGTQVAITQEGLTIKIARCYSNVA